MSTMPSNGSPPSTRSAITIIPAQVPSIGIRARARSRIGSTNPALFASLPIVVDSTPGVTKASTCSRSSGVRTSTGDAPRSARTRPCSRKSPCRARTPTFTRRSPPAGLEQTLLAELLDVDPLHRLAETVRDLGEDVGVVEVRGGLDDRAGSGRGVLGFEDPRAHEDAVHTELHHQRRVGRGGQPAGGEVHDGKLARCGDLADELDRSAELLARRDVLLGPERGEPGHLLQHRALVADGLDNVALSRLALRPYHRGALGDPAERLTEVASTAHERHGERPLVDVMLLVGGRQDLGLIHVVDPEGLEDLGLDEVPDPSLGHHRDRDGLYDLLDLRRVGHAGHAALLA